MNQYKSLKLKLGLIISSFFLQNCGPALEITDKHAEQTMLAKEIENTRLKIQAIEDDIFITPANPVDGGSAVLIWQKSSNIDGPYENVTVSESSDILNVKDLNLPFQGYVRFVAGVSTSKYDAVIASQPLSVNINEKAVIDKRLIVIDAPSEIEPSMLKLQVQVSDYQLVQSILVKIASESDRESNYPYDFNLDLSNFSGGDYTIEAIVDYGSEQVLVTQSIKIKQEEQATLPPTTGSGDRNIIFNEDYTSSTRNALNMHDDYKGEPYFGYHTSDKGMRGLSAYLAVPDNAPNNKKPHRSEFKLPRDLHFLEHGKRYAFGTKFMIPSDTLNTHNYKNHLMMIMQIHNKGQVPIGFNVKCNGGGKNCPDNELVYWVTVRDTKNSKNTKEKYLSNHPFIPTVDKWNELIFVYDVNANGNGTVEIHLNGDKVMESNNISTTNTVDNRPWMHFGIYTGMKTPFLNSEYNPNTHMDEARHMYKYMKVCKGADCTADDVR